MTDAERSMQAVRRAARRMGDAKKAADVAVRKHLPIGKRVWWEHGRHERSGIVNMHGMGFRVRVITGNNTEYWVDAWRITRRSW